nr:hypothetical protein [Microcystis aeruginosa]
MGVSPDEKIFTPTDERGFLPYTPHPTPSFQSATGIWPLLLMVKAEIPSPSRLGLPAVIL